MNTLFGLMLKDLYVFKSYKKNIIFSILVFIFLIGLASTLNNMVASGTILFLIFFGMNGISTFSYDEMSESEKYLLSLPVSRKDLVRSKYLFSLLNSLTSLIFGFLISILITVIITKNIPDLSDSIKISLIAFTSTSFLMCCDIPCIYKWGVEKGRMQAVIVPIIIFLFIGFLVFIPFIIFPEIFIKINLKMLYDNSLIICLILNILLYSISYIISYAIFKNKDL